MLSMPELSQLALEPPGRGGVLLAGLLASIYIAGTTKYYFTFYFAAVVLYLAVSVISNIVIKLLELRYRRGMTEPV